MGVLVDGVERKSDRVDSWVWMRDDSVMIIQLLKSDIGRREERGKKSRAVHYL